MRGRNISHYRIAEKLGEGGMGEVYRAEDVRLKRPVVLKFLRPCDVADPNARARLMNEARAAAALDHPNICTIFEIDECDGQPFISMAYLEGQDLSCKIATTRLQIEEILDIGIQIATALEEAHQNGIIHCDIKPANIMLTRQGRTVITDFGLADLSGDTELAKDGLIVGTVSYMSPEQTLGATVDQRTDIWSLGVLLYEMITGQRPFRGRYEPSIVYSILNELPQPMTCLRSGVPIELERIVGKALAKQPAKRYQRAGEILADLRTLQGSLQREPRKKPVPQGTAPWGAVPPSASTIKGPEGDCFNDEARQAIEHLGPQGPNTGTTCLARSRKCGPEELAANGHHAQENGCPSLVSQPYSRP